MRAYTFPSNLDQIVEDVIVKSGGAKAVAENIIVQSKNRIVYVLSQFVEEAILILGVSDSISPETTRIKRTCAAGRTKHVRYFILHQTQVAHSVQGLTGIRSTI
jgi:hypothetical protein